MKRNFIYQVLYQILLIILPFITTPYISRILGADGIGTFSYTYSIVSYFEIFAALGMAMYGNRKIAQIRDNIDLRDKTFWEIISFRFITSGITIGFYILFILLFHRREIVFYVCILDIVGVMFDISWFFFGIEEFKFTTLQNVFVRIISVIVTFLFVRSSKDVWIYTIIICGSNVAGQAILWIKIIKIVKFSKPTYKGIKQHVKFIFSLFIPVIAVSVYKLMDKIMLGTLASESEVGFYYSAEKIINIPTSVILALTTVMMPRISNLVVNNDNKNVKRLIGNTIDFMSCSSSALCFGLAAVMPQFVPLFFGQGYEKCIGLISLLAPVTMIYSFEQVLRTQYLTPNRKDKEYTISTFWGAIANICFNLLLIPKLGSKGAVIGTLAAEIVVALYQVFTVRKDLPIKEYILKYLGFAAIGFVMYILVRMADKLFSNSLGALLLEICIGATVYTILSILYMIKSKNAVWQYFCRVVKKSILSER